MKKVIILLLFNAFFLTSSWGQQLSIGFKPSFLVLNSKLDANLTGFPPMEVKLKSSSGIGITVSRQFKRFGLKVEPRYIIKGYKLDFIGEIDDYRNNYLSLPIIIFFSPVRNLNLEIGPEFSYLLNSKVRYYSQSSWLKNRSNNLKSFELSIIPGISYCIMKRFDLGIRYGIGLTPFDKGQFITSDSNLPPVDYKYFHSYFELYLNAKIFIKN
jgi:hypothetical protein